MLGTILGILWFILKIILWIVLGILCLFLLLILMVLLVPIRYKVGGSKYDDINGEVRVTYLLRLLRVYFHYGPEGYWYKVKVLFFTVLSESSAKGADLGEDVDERDRQPVTQPPDHTETTDTSVSDSQELPEKTELKQPVSEEQSITTVPESEAAVETEKPGQRTNGPADQSTEVRQRELSDQTSTTQTVKPKPKPEKKKKQQKKKAEESEGPSTMDKARQFWSFLREERNVGVLRFILKKVFGAVGSVLPKKFHAKIHFGLDDPATTAYIIGYASVLYAKYKDSLQITGDFNNQVIEGEVAIRGRIIPVVFVWTVIRIYLDGRVRRLIREVRSLT